MDFSFVFENKDFFNWTGSVFALRDTKYSLHQYVEETTKTELASWSDRERDHVKDFIMHNRSLSDHTVQQPLYKLKCKCIDCTDIYKKLTAMKSFPNKPLQLGKPSVYSEKWWIILKMFLPEGSSNTNCLEECDVAAFCCLLERCQLFDQIDNEKLQKIKTCRNKLMHSSSNEISTEQKTQYCDELISLCKNPSLNNRIEVQHILTKLDNRKVNLHLFDSPLQEFETLRDAFQLQEKAIENDLEACKDIKECQLNGSELEKLLKQVKANKDMAQNIKEAKGKLVGTLERAIALGKKEGEDLFGSGFVGKTVGRLLGGAGANAAGRYKINSQYNS